MTRGAVRDPGVAENRRVVSIGRPPWWLLLVALVTAALISADLLNNGRLESVDLWISEIADGWNLVDSPAYPLVWVLTQLGGRAAILAVLAVLVGYLAWRRGTWLPLFRVLLALALLTAVVYGIKDGTGRTAPEYPGEFFFRADGASFPSGHVANAVLMWGVARWQAAEYRLPPRIQRTLWWLSVAGPLVTGLAMVSLNFHWISDAVVGAAVGIVLLGVVHALDEHVLSRWVRAHAGRQSA